MAKRGEDALMRHQKERGLRCDRCDGPAIPDNPLYTHGKRTFRHLDCGGKSAGISVDGRHTHQ